MRELMLRADEFTVDEMWIMLLAAAPTPPVPPADQVFMQLTGGMEPTVDDLPYIAPEPASMDLQTRNSSELREEK